jgi:hypothetical protein
MAVPAGPPILYYSALPGRRCAEANASPDPLLSRSPFLDCFRLADNSPWSMHYERAAVCNAGTRTEGSDRKID